VRSILSKTMPGTKPGGRPPGAVELSPEGALAAALSGSGDTPVYAFAPLPPGALMPGIGEPNIRAAETVSEAIRSALSQVSPRTRAVTLILPDTAVRVFMQNGMEGPYRGSAWPHPRRVRSRGSCCRLRTGRGASVEPCRS